VPRKPNAPKRAPSPETQQRRTLATLKMQLAILELKSAATHAAARRQMIAIAKDLLPVAAALGRRGRPRLLAVCAKIIADEKLNANLEVLNRS